MYQRSGSDHYQDDLVIELQATVAINRLAVTPDFRTLQLIDGYSPEIEGLESTSNGLKLLLNEGLANVNFSGIDLQLARTTSSTQTIQALPSSSVIVNSANPAEVLINLGQAWQANGGEALLLRPKVGASSSTLGVLTDFAGRTTPIWSGPASQSAESLTTTQTLVVLPSSGRIDLSLLGSTYNGYTFYITSTATASQTGVSVSGSSGDELVELGASADSLYAKEGHDTLSAGEGADSIDLGSGADTLLVRQGELPGVTFTDLGTANLGDGDTYHRLPLETKAEA